MQVDNEDQLGDGEEEEEEDDVVVTTQEEFAPHTWPTPVMGIQEVRQPATEPRRACTQSASAVLFQTFLHCFADEAAACGWLSRFAGNPASMPAGSGVHAQ